MKCCYYWPRKHCGHLSINRIKAVLSYNGVVKETKYYLGETEKVISDQGTAFVQYITVDGQLKAIISSEGGGHTPHYVYTDHLGSIVQVTNTAGNVVYSQNFDPWGRRRYMGTWTYIDENVPNNYPIWLYRGYTGHEHLRQFRLINMNGRIYDPELARMLSPDNYIQDGGYSQNYNRYSYAYNNPLKYTDPDGQIIELLVGVGVSVLGNGINNLLNDKPFFEGADKAATIGLFGGIFAMGIGDIASAIGNAYLSAGFQVVAHAGISGVFSESSGGTYMQGFISGGISSLTSSAAMALKVGPAGIIVIGSVTGGLTAALTGGNFWAGLRQGFIISALNHVGHLADDGGKGDGEGEPPSKLDQIAAELEAMKNRLANAFSDGVNYASSSFDVGGLGVPNDIAGRSPMGWKGQAWTDYDKAMFRFRFFGMTLKGKTAYNTLHRLKWGGRFFTGLSVAVSVTSNQSNGWKAADLLFTGLAARGGVVGVALSLNYNFNVKPYILNPVIHPGMNPLQFASSTYGYYLMSKR